MIRKIGLLGFFLVFISSTLFIYSGISSKGEVRAANGNDFKAGRIIDDVIFTNNNSMSVAQIQAFLDAKVPVCDRWRPSSNPNYQPPWTCLKEYQENPVTGENNLGPAGRGPNGEPRSISGGKSAAQLIWDAAQAHNINPQVILVTLQKEQSLVTDDWPWAIQYWRAMGNRCPDGPGGAQCDASYAGFAKQVDGGAWQFRHDFEGIGTADYWAPYERGWNNILYQDPNTNAGCGTKSVYIENQATAVLYKYTPYTPNQAALNNLYGTGDSCSSYGNRNFWRLFTDWFGSTTNDAYAWDLVQQNSDGKIYLVSNRTYYWVPGPLMMAAWGLDKFPVRSVDNTYVASLTKGPDLNYVALDASGLRYLMSNGKKYLLQSDAYVLAWGVAGIPHIWAPGTLTQIESGGTAGRFARSASGGDTYLMAGYAKHKGITPSSLSYYGQNTGNTTIVSDDVLSRLPTGADIDRYIRADSKNYIADNGSLIQFSNPSIEHAWGSKTYVTIHVIGANLFSKRNGSTFVIAEGDPRWFYIENGNLHYLPNLASAEAWGWGANNPLLNISPSLLGEFNLSTQITTIVKSAGDNSTYLVAKQKRTILSPQLIDTLSPSDTIPTYSAQSLGLIPTSNNVISPVIAIGGNIYIADNGVLRHIPNLQTLDAFNGFAAAAVTPLSQSMSPLFAYGPAVSYVMKTGDGRAYYFEKGKKFEIVSTAQSTWSVGNSPVAGAKMLAAIPDGGSVGVSVSNAGKRYLVNNSTLLDVTSDYDNYGIAANSFISLQSLPFSVSQQSSHLVGTNSSGKIWLLSSGKRYHITTPDILFDLGYGTHSSITNLSADIIALLPEQPAIAGRVLKAPGTGMVFASLGKGFGFLDGNTLSNYIGTGSVFTVPTSVFNKFGLWGWSQQVIYGSDGKVYAAENGQKRWITSPAVLNSQFSGAPWLNLPQSTVNGFPTGQNIN